MNKKIIRKYVLKNAATHNGKSVSGAIIPKLLGEEPKLKSKIKVLMKDINKIVFEVNKLSVDEQKRELLKLDKHALDKKIEKKELPVIRGIRKGKCSFRLPPGPEKELHIGHALSYLLNYYYSQKYDGQLILRFEDTNPEKCEQRFVDGNKADLKALGIKWNKEIYLSDNMKEYYRLADNLIKSGDAYVCNCDVDKMREDRKKHIRCSCAENKVNANLKEWNKMKYGIYKEGTKVLRFKGDMKNKNSTLWDPVIFRINKTKHYRQGSKFPVWPLYDFTASVEDAKITHVLRDANWTQRIELQDMIRKKLGFKKNPKNILYARYEVAGGVTKGRVIRELVEKNIVDGYDDIRLLTIKGLMHRGILAETFMQLLIEMGITKSKTTIQMDKVFSINKRILDKVTNHYFFVEDPVILELINAPKKPVEVPLSPYSKETRTIQTTNQFYIQNKDAKLGLILLKNCYNVKITKIAKDKIIGEFVAEKTVKDLPIVQWVAFGDEKAIIIKEPLELFDNRGKLNKKTIIEHQGVAEKAATELPINTIVQFERFAFCKKDEDCWILTHR